MAIISTTTAATRRSLTTAERYRELMPATDALEAKLESLIGQATAAIERYLGRIVARERVTERLRLDASTVCCVLERRPVVTIHAVTVVGQALDATRYRVENPSAGLLRLEGSGPNALWDELVGQYGQGDYGYRSGPPRTLVYEIDYTAGFAVPGQGIDPVTLPDDLEAACQLAVRGVLERQERSAGVVSEKLGDASWTYAPAAVTAGLLTDDVKALIDPYRNVAL
jgi:hypothetical protein